MRVIKQAIAAAGMGLLVALAGCSSSTPTLIPGLSDSPPNPAKGISGVSLPMRGDTFSLELDEYLCAVRDVRLTSVRLYRPSGGIRLTRWGVENRTITENGQAVGPLDRLGPFTSHRITRRCHQSWYSRLGLELHRIKPGTVSFLGLRITYNSDGRQKVAYLWEQFHIREPRNKA